MRYKVMFENGDVAYFDIDNWRDLMRAINERYSVDEILAIEIL